MGADIFISYVEEDSAAALELADALQDAGYTTWCYEVDSASGVSSLSQTSRAVEESRAVIVLISPHSLGSHQVTREVVRAHETEKPFIPVLISISHVEYTTRQPEWREAIGSATTISVPAGGVGLIVSRILGGLKALGIEASGEGVEPTDRRGATAQPAASVGRERRGKKKGIVAAVLAVGLVAAAAGALALRGDDAEEESAATEKTTAAVTTEAAPDDEILDSATTPVETSGGPARVSQARLFSELCPPPNIPEPCDVAPGGGQFLVVELVAWSEEDVLLFDSIFMEAFQSHVVYERGEIGASTLQMLLDSTGRQIPTGIQVVFSVLPPSAAGQNVDLYWPGSQPVRVPVSV